MNRYKTIPTMSPYGITYAVVDTGTGETVTSYGCQLWADRRAKELNDEYKCKTVVHEQRTQDA